MAVQCCICDNKLRRADKGVSIFPDKRDEKYMICNDCMQIINRSKNNDALAQVRLEKYKSRLTDTVAIHYIDSILLSKEDLDKIEEIRKKEEERKEAEKQKFLEEREKRDFIRDNYEKLEAGFMMTTGFDFEGYIIKKYLGIATGTTVIGTGLFSESAAAVSDFFGAESNAFADKLEVAKDSAIDKLTRQCIYMGANAIIGVDVDCTTFFSNMIGVVVTGTAVVIEKSENR